MQPHSEADQTHTPGTDERTALEEIEAANKESVDMMQSLVEEMKIVQEHESTVLAEDDEPPLFVPQSDVLNGRIP